jgi:diaminohydroxyphosphoribosylaminopyrimidine deaminase/5-amino-6-(5-phosphoribosylamino)uracil reductase
MSSEDFMKQAITLGEKARHITPPLAWIGCVISSPEGQVIGEGFSGEEKAPLAEIMALCSIGIASNISREAKGIPGEAIQVADASQEPTSKNLRPGAGSTCHVTLEPLHDRVGEAKNGIETHAEKVAKALVSAGISQVVVGMFRPRPEYTGKGIAVMKEAGLFVTVLSTLHADALAIRESLKPFLHHAHTGRPYCLLQVAQSLDGCIAAPNGDPWQAGIKARQHMQELHQRGQALIMGVESAMQDRILVNLPSSLWVVVISSSTKCLSEPSRVWNHPRCLLFVTQAVSSGDETNEKSDHH